MVTEGNQASDKSVEWPEAWVPAASEVPGVWLQGHIRDLFQGQRRSFGGDRLMGRAARGPSMWGREQVAGKPPQGVGRAQGVQCNQSVMRLEAGLPLPASLRARHPGSEQRRGLMVETLPELGL